MALWQSGRLLDARVYAIAARDGFASCDPSAANKVQEMQQLIDWIEAAIAGKKG